MFVRPPIKGGELYAVAFFHAIIDRNLSFHIPEFEELPEAVEPL
jgi:hypothetical protein